MFSMALLILQITAVLQPTVQLDWPPASISTYLVSRQCTTPTGPTQASWTIRTAAFTDSQIRPGWTCTYSISPSVGNVTITVPAQPDIQVILKKGAKIQTVPITKRKGDTSTTAPILINKSTRITVETK